METDWIIIAMVVVFGLVVILLLIIRNLKDKKQMEKFFNEDYKANPSEETEINDDER